MEEVKMQYEVVEEVEIAGYPQPVGTVIELTEEQATEFGAKVKLVEDADEATAPAASQQEAGATSDEAKPEEAGEASGEVA